MKILSIIIPIYNMEEYLLECLKSLKKQNFDDSVEVLLIDDGSTDSSLEICEKFIDNDPVFRVIHQENCGVSSARNTGLINACGEYLAWVDPDDYLADDWWNTIRLELDNRPDMLYFDMTCLKNGKYYSVHYDKQSGDISNYDLCRDLALDKIKSHLWSKIIRRKFFNQSFSTKYSYCEDYALLHHVVFKIKKCRYINKSLYVYRQRDTSIVHDKSKRLDNYRLAIRLSKRRYCFFRKNNIEVPYDGVYLAMIDYCFEYDKCYGEYRYSSQERHNTFYIRFLRNAFFTILCSKYVSLKRKIKLIVIMTRRWGIK